MAAETPGGALFAPPNTGVIDPLGTSLIAPTAVPEEAEYYVLRTSTRGTSTPHNGTTQPETNDAAPVTVDLPSNSPKSSPIRATTTGLARVTG